MALCVDVGLLTIKEVDTKRPEGIVSQIDPLSFHRQDPVATKE